MKVGLKETLSLLAAGYKKKDIDATLSDDDNLFDLSDNNAVGIIKSLNKHGIYTVDDLIKSNDENLPFYRKKEKLVYNGSR